MIRLLIVADQPTIQKGLQMLLATEVDLCVVGETSDCNAALDLVTSLCPDVVLIDVDMPESDGLSTARTLHYLCPQAAMIILSINDDALTCARAAEAGSAAFVTKSMPAVKLLAEIRRAAFVS
jgi:DNA-binding NarL/FixJ family response regulator